MIYLVEDISGIWHRNINEIGEVITNHFKHILAPSDGSITTMPIPPNLFPLIIIPYLNNSIYKSLTSEEIHNMNLSLGSLKVLGLDGFPILFY